MASRKRSLSNDADVSPLYYKEWDEASCPICMDHPHNAVLLICSSHNKGCRSYICDTSYRHSNCLDRFKKLKEEQNPENDPSSSSSLENPPQEPSGGPDTQQEWSKLKCPLCRGSILGWKVLEDARKYLNSKPRSCSRETCSFSGNYGDLRAHARRVHPTVRPADVDPTRQRAWRRLEDQREYNDIVSALRSAMPGAVVIGDYMIDSGERVLGGERNNNGGAGAGEGGRWLSTTLVLFQMIGSLDHAGAGGRSRVLGRHRRASGSISRRRYLWGENLLDLQEDDEEDEDDGDGDEDEQDLNVPSDLGPPNRRRRRRLTRAQPDEDQQ